MKLILTLLLCLTASMALANDTQSTTVPHGLVPVRTVGLVFSDNDLPAHLPYIRDEKGARPLGYQIGGEIGVEHEAGEEDQPAVFFYVMDKHSKKRSSCVGTYYYHEHLTFQWFHQQKFLLVATNRHKDFYICVYARDIKGNFKMLDADIDPYETRKKIFAAVYLIKNHPEWEKTKKYPKQDITTYQRVDNGYVSTEDISVGDNFVDVPVEVQDVDPEVTIRYRFDTDTRKFTRLDATLKEEYNDPGFKVSNTQLEKVLPKIVLKPSPDN